MIISKIKWEFEGFLFLIRNCLKVKKLNTISEMRNGFFIFRNFKKTDFKEIKKLHSDFRNGYQINFWRQILFLLFGKYFINVVTFKNKEILGFQMLYFKKNDISNNVIHEAYIGIKSNSIKQGIGSKLRNFSIHKLRNSSVIGISTQIESSNKLSLNSALKVGFKFKNKKLRDNNYILFYKLYGNDKK